jgi:hypothetical protein
MAKWRGLERWKITQKKGFYYFALRIDDKAR